MEPEKLYVPDAARLPNVQRLCDWPEPYLSGAEQEEWFVAAMREIVAWHRDHCTFYRELLRRRGFPPERLAQPEDCADTPMVYADFFKSHEIMSVPPEKVFQHLTSSGTTGQKSQMFFDEWSLRSAQRMIDFIFAYYGLYTPDKPANYLLYAYETKPESGLGTSFTSHYLCKYAPARRVVYALRATGEDTHEFDVFGCIRALQEFAEEQLPVRIIGFPAFLHFTLERMRHLGLRPLELAPDSLVFLSGGWKGYADRQIPKNELLARLTEQLGIPGERCREAFGSVEHCVPYIECQRHHLHVPAYSRVFARDVRSLRVLDYDQPGFLHFVTPHITSVPAHSVMMGDLIKLHPAEACDCGANRPYFEILGRAGTSRNRSCAIAAAELLKKHFE
jgi:phenylacetate-coenzyme A ligase PaaK-like adenylate-forming protein